jgi:uncharacterized protein YjiS (DUF1127 family)
MKRGYKQPIFSFELITRNTRITAMGNRFFETLSRIGATVAKSRIRSRTRAQLECLSDRQLADIGVRRDQIASIVRNGLAR